MSIEILVNAGPGETRAVLVEEGVVQEIYVERRRRRGLVSNLYQGRVTRVLPGMQAAFIDIGLERTAFLHAADIATPPADETVAALVPLGAAPAEDVRRLLSPATTSWSRSSRIRSAPRERVSRPTSPCRRAFSYTCRAAKESASRRESRTRPSASDSKRRSRSCAAPKPTAAISCARRRGA